MLLLHSATCSTLHNRLHPGFINTTNYTLCFNVQYLQSFTIYTMLHKHAIPSTIHSASLFTIIYTLVHATPCYTLHLDYIRLQYTYTLHLDHTTLQLHTTSRLDSATRYIAISLHLQLHTTPRLDSATRYIATLLHLHTMHSLANHTTIVQANKSYVNNI